MEWRKSIGTFGSSRSTDRIRGMKLLNRLLDSNEHIKELKTAEETKKVSMNEVFQSFHKVLVKEAWRVRDKQGRVAAATSSAATMNTELKKLFSKILIKSREDILKIAANNLIASLKEVFHSKYLREEFGGTYFVKITSVLLNRRTYWGELTASNWKDLMTTSIIAYNENLSGMDKSRVSTTIAYIIAQGSLNSDLPLWITSKIKFMTHVVKRIEVTHVPESNLLLGLSFVTKIAKENRKLACKFGEEIMDTVLGCYNPLVTELNTMKCIVLETLIFQIKIHHPNGATMESPCAYTHDFQKWKTSIVKMNSLMQEEVTQMKTKIPNISVKEAILGRFLEFAVKISKQIMDISVVETDETLDSSISNESGFKRMLIFLQNLPEQSTWAWLYILSAVIKKYDCIDDCTYILLLNYLRNFISSSRDILTLDCYFRCCSALAEVKVPDNCDIADYTRPWGIIYDKALWAIGLNRSENSAQKLICCLLERKFLIVKNQVEDVFNMYLKNCVTPSEESFKTLNLILSSYNLFNSMKIRTRQLCMKWIFPVKESFHAFQGILPVELVADISVQLCLTQNIKKVLPKKKYINVGSLEHLYSMMTFNSGLLKQQIKEPRDPECTFPDCIFMEEASFNVLKCMITQSGEGIVSCTNKVLTSGAEQEEGHGIAEFMTALLQLIALISSNFITLRVCTPTSTQISSLMHVFKTILENLTDLLEAMLKSKESMNKLTKTFFAMVTLYELDINEFIGNFIRENTPKKLTRVIIALLTERAGLIDVSPHYIRPSPEKNYISGTTLNCTDYHSILDSNIFSDNTALIILGCKIMGAFTCKCGNSLYYPHQIEVLLYFLEEQLKEIRFPLSFQMLMGFLYFPIRRLTMDNDFLSRAFCKFETLMKEHANDAEMLQIFLSILEGVATKAVINPSVQEVVIKYSEFYLKKLHNRLLERKLPSSLAVKIFRLLGCLIKINPKIKWSWLLNSDNNQMTITDVILQGLDSPYAEVRMVIAENLYPLIHPLRHGSCAEHKSTLMVWINYLTNCCYMKDPLLGEEQRENYIKVGIHCVSLIAVSCPSFTIRAIFYVLRLMHNQQIDRGLGKRIFGLIGEELQANKKVLLCEYMLDLIEKWIMLSDIKDFPFWLIYESIEEFYIENAGTIFPILWLANHQSLHDFCIITEKSIPQMLEDHSAIAITLAMSQYWHMENEGQLAMGKATSVIDQIFKVYPDLDLYKFLSSDNNSIMYTMFRFFYDSNKITTVSGDSIFAFCCHKLCYAERRSYHYSSEMIDKLFNQLFLWNKERNGVKYINYLLGESPSHIRYVLLHLANDVINAQTPCIAITALVAFQFYVDYMIGNMVEIESVRGRMNATNIITGLIRDTSFSLMRIMKKWSQAENDTVLTLAFLYLYKNLTEHFVQMFQGRNVVLVPIVYAIVDMIKGGNLKFLEERTLNLMETLINIESLKEELYYLMPFPNTKKYQKLNMVLNQMAGDRTKTSLKNDIMDFLEAHETYGFTRVEMLQLLQQMLNKKKEDLQELYDDMEAKSDAYEYYGKCVLHRAITFLVLLCAKSDNEISKEAAKCLAELCPSDLGPTVLLPLTTVSKAKTVPGNQHHKLTIKCLELLPRYLLDLSIEVMEATSTALIAIMTSAEGESTIRGELPRQMKLAGDYIIMEKMFPVNIQIFPLEFNKMAFSMLDDLWVPTEDQNHSQWIMALVPALIHCFSSPSSYLETLKRICCLKVSLCEELLPYVLELFIESMDIQCKILLTKKLCSFFETAYHTFSSRAQDDSLQGGKVIKQKDIMITMINAINYLNLQHHEVQIHSDEQERECLDLLHCALVAQHCSAYCSAIQYCELWLSNISKGNEPKSINFHIKAGTPHIEDILSILRESYAGLGNTDGVFGCGTSHLLEPIGRVEHFKHMEKWQQLMRSYELEIAYINDKSPIEGLLTSLQMLGMEELLMGLLDTREEDYLLEYKYECSWRLCSWDLLSQFSNRKRSSPAIYITENIPKFKKSYIIDEKLVSLEYHSNLFFAICSIRDGKYTESLNQLNNARQHMIDSLSIASLEGYKSINRPISQLQAIKEVEEFAKAFQLSRKSALTNIIGQWRQHDYFGGKTFKSLEPIKALRLSLLKSSILESKRNVRALNINETSVLAMAEIQLQLAQSAREAGVYEISEKYLRAVRELSGLEYKPLLLSQLQFQEAELQWLKKNSDVAMIMMKSLVEGTDPMLMDENLAQFHGKALTVLGHWVMKMHSKNVKDTLSKYFARARDLMNEYMVDNTSKEYLSSMRAIAEYAYEQYILTSKYIDSASFSQKEQGALEAKYIVSDYIEAKKLSIDEKRSLALLSRQAKIDEKELEQCEADKNSFLEISLSYFIKFLKFSPQIDMPLVFRFVSLLLEIKSPDQLSLEEIESIPLYKFINVIPQLLPRIVQAKGNCSRILKSIVEKCAIIHPYHVLPHILALAYSLKDLDKAEGSDAFMTETQKNNQGAAQRMMAKLRKLQSLTEHVKEHSQLWEALISAAYLKLDLKKNEIIMGKDVVLAKLKDLTYVQVPTVELAISPTGEYNRITSVFKFMPKFTLVGGINMPKKITCVGSDGKKYKQLLKSKDDLRQDAVMQQVFLLINSILNKDGNTQKRKLRIRTYKVVPLSHRSGIIEWCTNTTAIGSYLQGTKNVLGAHAIFNPSDYSIHNCKNMLKNVQKEPKNIRLQVFLEICDHLRPVFRHYFFHKYPSPAVWYEKIQSYTKSVATSSMIGYILGLGDRHLQNILIDRTTAEVLHVDLGIAFEQGKTISIPETVPFRLTRDILDGMGASGVEGVFRKSCEVTMALMRKHRQTILAVLEVLIYDPLYAWTLKAKYKMLEADIEAGLISSNTSTTTPSGDANAAAPLPKIYKQFPLPAAVEPPAETSKSENNARASTSTSGKTSFITTEEGTERAEQNATAMRALERVEQKLLGTEDGTSASSIEAQVERLIQEARDPENLCLLYSGWQPFL